ncbi:MAG: glycosyltransferase family 39 protein [Patescibacteria group bacterium]|nr:glycosyltransferase family 39 protein [Patescibacteria group bacterium]
MNREKWLFFWWQNRILILILVGSFLLCLAYSFYFKIEPAVDALAYDKIAQNIANGNGYRENLQTDLIHDSAIARVGPLYEYFLAGIYKIFGHHYGSVWTIQAILHSLAAWLVYLVSILIFADSEQRKKIGLWAAAMVGFYPDLIEISAMLMTETLYLFFICLFLYLFFRFFYQQKNWLLIFLLGAVSGLAVLARPPVLFLLPVVYFLFFRKKLFWQAVVFSVVLFLVFTPWTARNYFTYKEIMPFGAAGNFNFWIGNYHGGSGEQEPTEEHIQFAATHGVKEINGESIRQFKSFLFNHQFEFIKLTFLRINKYFSIIRPMGFWFYQVGWSQFLFIISSALVSVFLFVLSLGGAIKASMAHEEKLCYLLALTIITPLIIFITVVETRYRFQIYPLLAIFAGYFMVLLKKESKRWTNKILWLAIALIFTNGLVDLVLSLARLKERLGLFF